jgi:hypothetical protein
MSKIKHTHLNFTKFFGVIQDGRFLATTFYLMGFQSSAVIIANFLNVLMGFG